MCGIAGVVDAASAPEARVDAVARMCNAMLHRGPDDHGWVSRGPATIGMRRLAIFDPAHGHQPMESPDGRFALVFNGAIYNFRALRDELATHGWAFRTQCDTEVLLAAYATWGADCLNRLRGMFAFAAWDNEKGSLFLARDPFGIKPLYFRQHGTRLLFASELSALCATGLFAPEIDPISVSDYLAWFAVPAPHTIYRGVLCLRPGECAEFRNGNLSIHSAWRFRTIPDAAQTCRSRSDFIYELRERLEDSIRAHMLADVPVGAFLSGGLDSAVVTGLMTRAGASQLRTFSIGFGEAGYSEADAAEETARHFGTRHRTAVLTGAQVAEDFEKLVQAFDQPTGDGINTYYASAAARQGGVTVALSGLGADELFGGYPSFRDTPRLARWLPLWRTLPRPLRSSVIDRLRRSDTRRRKLADVLEHARDIHEVGALQRRVFTDEGTRRLLAAEILPTLALRPPVHPEFAALSSDLSTSEAFEIVSAWELRTYMADVLLRDSDVMSMRHSLELRVPFVDRPLIEWLWQQPAAFKHDASAALPKPALREAVADILPASLLARPKRGFTLPLALWMKRELRPFLAETFSDASLRRAAFFDPVAVQGLWKGFLEGDDTREWSRVWSLAMLVAFANRPTLGTGPVKAATPAVLSSTPSVPTPTPVSASDSGSRAIAGTSRKPVRTLLLAPEIFASEGGIPRIMRLYLKALSDIERPDRSVGLLAMNDRRLSHEDLRGYANGTLSHWTACNRNKPHFIRAALRASRTCERMVCGHIFQLPVAYFAQRFNPRLRYYLVAHGIEVWRPFSAIERLALRRAERVLCVSDFTRQEVLRHSRISADRAVVLHNALDPYFEIKAGRPVASCPPVILVVTRLSHYDRYKGVHHMIEALPHIRAQMPDARLRIVGRGDDLPYLQQLARDLKIQDAVDFTGFVDDRRLAEEMATCRLFALPSRKEGFGLVFLEAMARGRPCLGARAGGVPEVIDNTSGVLIEYGNIPDIARACVESLQRDWSQEPILERARQFSYPVFQRHLAGILGA